MSPPHCSLVCGLSPSGVSTRSSIVLDGPWKLRQEVDRVHNNVHLVDVDSVVQLLRACILQAALPEGRRVHQLLVKWGLEHDDLVGNHLVHMYLKCGSYQEARKAFSKVNTREIGTWNSIISAAATKAHYTEVFDLYTQMRSEREEWKRPNKLTFISVLSAFSSPAAVAQGRIVHADIRSKNLEHDLYVGTALLNMYGRCRSLESAQEVFSRMERKDLVSWNSMIMACADNDDFDRALGLIRRMWHEGLSPNRSSFVAFLSCCNTPRLLQRGREIHEKIQEMGLLSDVFLATAVVTMYGKCGSLGEAKTMFEKMTERNVVSWNAMAAANALCGDHPQAFIVYKRMLLEGFTPNTITYVTLLKACSEPETLPEGREVHQWVRKAGLEADVLVGTSVMTMYGNCGEVDEARAVFNRLPNRNIVTWNAMLTAYGEQGRWKEAVELFREMVQQAEVSRSLAPNTVTYLSLLNSCGAPEALEAGNQIHSRMMESGRLISSETCIGNASVAMFSKCGDLDRAMQVFEGMRVRDNISWNGMVAALSSHDRPREALAMFHRMQQQGFKPDRVTLVSVLDLCADLGTIELGNSIHHRVPSLSDHFQTQSDLVIQTAAMNMYAKCGCLIECEQLFEKLQLKDLVAWNTMISAFAQNGQGRRALKLFRLLQQGREARPNSATFISVITGCSHSGLLEDACQTFHLVKDFGVRLSVEHYTCLADALGRMGYISQAEGFLRSSPEAESDPVVWTSLLSACSSYNDLETGERVANRLIELDPGNSAGYVVLCNIYSAAGRFDDARRIRELMFERGVRKTPGLSWLVVKNRVHEFCARDRRHPRSVEIYQELERLRVMIEAAGYVSDTSKVVHDVDEEEKGRLVWFHSERLAIAFGLMSSRTGVVRVMKNLRVCEDCHTATKFISRVVKREIVVRDSARFHHFSNGSCSCGDYW